MVYPIKSFTQVYEHVASADLLRLRVVFQNFLQKKAASVVDEPVLKIKVWSSKGTKTSKTNYSKIFNKQENCISGL